MRSVFCSTVAIAASLGLCATPLAGQWNISDGQTGRAAAVRAPLLPAARIAPGELRARAGRVITGKKLDGLSHYGPELRGCPGGSCCCIAEPSGRTDLRPRGNPPKLGVRRQRSQELTARQV